MIKLKKGTEMFVLPDFGKIQLASFHRFIEYGLLEELKNFPKIQDNDQEFEFQLFGEQYRLGEPLLNEQEAVYQSTSYASELYVPAQLAHKKEGKVQRQTVFLGSLPLMSSKGTFVINGISRVLVNQILRSPGIYYNSESDHNGIAIYSATIISDWGGRLKIEIDSRGRIWARISRKRKVLIVILLLAMGLDMKHILAGVSYPKMLIESKKRSKEYPQSMEDAMIELYRQLYSVGGDLNFSESISRELQKRFFQQRCELGTIGRSNFNRRLGLNVSENEKFLLPQDLLAAVDYLIKIKFGMGHLDDIDHLKNRRVRSVNDLLIDQLKISLNRLESIIRQALRGAGKRRRLPTPKSLVSSVPLVNTFKDFFGSHPLSQFLDQTNPLTEIVHKRRLSSLGPGGLTRRTASFQVRDIHPSHYGRICPIETSEGMNAGLIASLATYARVNNRGFIESPFYKIFEGSLKEDVVYMTVGEDENYRIATGNCLALDHNSQSQQKTAARYQQEFITTSWDKVHFRSIFPLQYFSVGASLIPFLEHDDANRALMGSNMQRQAVPLLQPEKPIIGTGLEAQTALDSGTVIIANENGKVEYMDGKQIHLMVDCKKQIQIDLADYQRSNNNTCINQRPTVQIGEYVKQGQILADGAATAGGELALGKNVVVAYMPWEGYNFEDAVLINERLVYENIYTSLHIEKYEIEIRSTNQGPEKITKEIPHLDENLLRHLDENGIVLPGSWVEVGDVLVGKLTPQETDEPLRAPEGKLLQAIFGLQVATAKETSLKVPTGGKGRVIDVRWIYQEEHSFDHTDIIHVYILQKRRIQTGDKVAGRHGNKGIVSRILSREDMPYLQDGTPVDMVLSPLGVPSRMNVGQIFECLLGLAGKFLTKHYRVMPFDERYEREASRKLVFSELYKASQETGYSWLFEPESPGKSKLFDGRTGETFDQHATVGNAYMLKLIHQVDDKIHARSSGPYALVTQQPLRGRSRRGGQRVGEMEVWALEGFGAAYILQEMLTIKSDHIKARYEVLGAIVTGEPVPKPTGAPESFRLLVRELRSLGLEIGHSSVSQRDLSANLHQI